MPRVDPGYGPIGRGKAAKKRPKSSPPRNADTGDPARNRPAPKSSPRLRGSKAAAKPPSAPPRQADQGDRSRGRTVAKSVPKQAVVDKGPRVPRPIRVTPKAGPDSQPGSRFEHGIEVPQIHGGRQTGKRLFDDADQYNAYEERLAIKKRLREQDRLVEKPKIAKVKAELERGASQEKGRPKVDTSDRAAQKIVRDESERKIDEYGEELLQKDQRYLVDGPRPGSRPDRGIQAAYDKKQAKHDTGAKRKLHEKRRGGGLTQLVKNAWDEAEDTIRGLPSTGEVLVRGAMEQVGGTRSGIGGATRAAGHGRGAPKRETPITEGIKKDIQENDPAYALIVKRDPKEALGRSKERPLTALGEAGAVVAPATGAARFAGGASTAFIQGKKAADIVAAGKHSMVAGKSAARARPDLKVARPTGKPDKPQRQANRTAAKTERKQAKTTARESAAGKAAPTRKPGERVRGRTYAHNPLVRGAQKATDRAKTARGVNPNETGRRQYRRQEKRRFDQSVRNVQAAGIGREEEALELVRHATRGMNTREKAAVELLVNARVDPKIGSVPDHLRKLREFFDEHPGAPDREKNLKVVDDLLANPDTFDKQLVKDATKRLRKQSKAQDKRRSEHGYAEEGQLRHVALMQGGLARGEIVERDPAAFPAGKGGPTPTPSPKPTPKPSPKPAPKTPATAKPAPAKAAAKTKPAAAKPAGRRRAPDVPEGPDRTLGTIGDQVPPPEGAPALDPWEGRGWAPESTVSKKPADVVDDFETPPAGARQDPETGEWVDDSPPEGIELGDTTPKAKAKPRPPEAGRGTTHPPEAGRRVVGGRTVEADPEKLEKRGGATRQNLEYIEANKWAEVRKLTAAITDAVNNGEDPAPLKAQRRAATQEAEKLGKQVDQIAPPEAVDLPSLRVREDEAHAQLQAMVDGGAPPRRLKAVNDRLDEIEGLIGQHGEQPSGRKRAKPKRAAAPKRKPAAKSTPAKSKLRKKLDVARGELEQLVKAGEGSSERAKELAGKINEHGSDGDRSFVARMGKEAREARNLRRAQELPENERGGMGRESAKDNSRKRDAAKRTRESVGTEIAKLSGEFGEARADLIEARRAGEGEDVTDLIIERMESLGDRIEKLQDEQAAIPVETAKVNRPAHEATVGGDTLKKVETDPTKAGSQGGKVPAGQSPAEMGRLSGAEAPLREVVMIDGKPHVEYAKGRYETLAENNQRIAKQREADKNAAKAPPEPKPEAKPKPTPRYGAGVMVEHPLGPDHPMVTEAQASNLRAAGVVAKPKPAPKRAPATKRSATPASPATPKPTRRARIAGKLPKRPARPRLRIPKVRRTPTPAPKPVARAGPKRAPVPILPGASRHVFADTGEAVNERSLEARYGGDAAFLRGSQRPKSEDRTLRAPEAGEGYNYKDMLGPLGEDRLRDQATEHERQISFAQLHQAVMRDHAISTHSPGPSRTKAERDLEDELAYAEAVKAAGKDESVEKMGEDYVVLPDFIAKRVRGQLSEDTRFMHLRKWSTRMAIRATLPFAATWHAGNAVDLMARLALTLPPGTIAEGRQAEKALRQQLEALSPDLRHTVLNSMKGHFGSRETVRHSRVGDWLPGQKPGQLSNAVGDFVFAGKGRNPLNWLGMATDEVFDISSKAEAGLVKPAIGAHARQMAKDLGIQAKDIDDAMKEFAKVLESDPNRVHELQDRILETVGDFATKSPTDRQIMAGVDPFWTWLRESSKFVLKTLPANHPKRTAMLLMAASMTQDERAKAGFNYYFNEAELDKLHAELGYKNQREGYFSGGIGQDEGKVIPAVGLTSFGEVGANMGDPRRLAGRIGSYIQRPLAAAGFNPGNLIGAHEKDEPDVKRDERIFGHSYSRTPAERALRGLPDSFPLGIGKGEMDELNLPGSGGRRAAALGSESVVPGLRQIRGVREGGKDPRPDSTAWDPHTQGKGERDTRRGIDRTFNPTRAQNPRVSDKQRRKDILNRTPVVGIGELMPVRMSDGTKRWIRRER